MGNVHEDTFDLDMAKKFSQMNVFTREECGQCWAKFYCSGGCSASNFNVNGDVKKPNRVGCELEKKRLECAIALKAIRAGIAD